MIERAGELAEAFHQTSATLQASGDAAAGDLRGTVNRINELGEQLLERVGRPDPLVRERTAEAGRDLICSGVADGSVFEPLEVGAGDVRGAIDDVVELLGVGTSHVRMLALSATSVGPASDEPSDDTTARFLFGPTA